MNTLLKNMFKRLSIDINLANRNLFNLKTSTDIDEKGIVTVEMFLHAYIETEKSKILNNSYYLTKFAYDLLESDATMAADFILGKNIRVASALYAESFLTNNYKGTSNSEKLILFYFLENFSFQLNESYGDLYKDKLYTFKSNISENIRVYNLISELDNYKEKTDVCYLLNLLSNKIENCLDLRMKTQGLNTLKKSYILRKIVKSINNKEGYSFQQCEICTFKFDLLNAIEMSFGTSVIFAKRVLLEYRLKKDKLSREDNLFYLILLVNAIKNLDCYYGDTFLQNVSYFEDTIFSENSILLKVSNSSS